MDPLANIRLIVNKIQSDITFHPTSIAYLWSLMTPLIIRLNNIQTDNVEQLVDRLIQGLNIIYLNIALIREGRKGTNITDTKQNIINYLIDDIAYRASNFSRDYGDGIVLPWDIKYCVEVDSEIALLLGVQIQKDRNATQLPVIIRLNNDNYEYELTRNFVAGLLAFTNVSGCNIQVYISGEYFDTNYIVSPGNRFLVKQIDDFNGYIITIGNYVYNLDTKSMQVFMQGFTTGSQSCGVDHHLYWSNFLLNDGNKIIPVTF
jgi:hypothetical protein